MMSWNRSAQHTRTLLSVCAAGVLAAAAPAAAQATLERTPNLSAGWTGPGNRLDFHLVHRFNHSGAPERQVQNRASLLLAWELPWNALVGTVYSTRSALAAGVPNEWEPFIRVAPITGENGARLAAQFGYNAAARSIDAELTGTRRFGVVQPVLALRVLGNDAATGDTRFAAAGGAVLRLHRHVAVAADAARLLGDGDADVVWGAGVQLRIPASPHSLSLHATNADALTLYSASRSGGRVRWGFEFTVPVTPARFFSRATWASSDDRGSTAGGATAENVAEADTVRVVMKEMAFAPRSIRIRAGTVVRWRNEDEVMHTVRAADGSWDSGLIESGAVWHRRFDRTGVYRITCGPHPFMTLEVTVVECSSGCPAGRSVA